MGKPVLVIVNGLPGSGKSTLAKRLATDMPLPVFSRDGIHATLYDVLECSVDATPPRLGHAAYALLYSSAGSLLAASQSVVIEAFFGNPKLRGAELADLKRMHDFEPLQIMCKADGEVLLERFLKRVASAERHAGLNDMEWLEENKERILRGRLESLALGGRIIEFDTTTSDNLSYANLLQQVRTALTNSLAH
ncbi:AAA family ATPase [Ktedonospora formicarum]|uniref:Kinase n=1 Tax=Ktedonospora formicarum TaxID=2778364 RepID=A0A8J3MPL2_9CHLR|nr:ATP-binding protein [Ktedonospora formicarum]GHO43030.1 hypothetical protein KSX_11930 [Ktedonospora formicarum]